MVIHARQIWCVISCTKFHLGWEEFGTLWLSNFEVKYLSWVLKISTRAFIFDFPKSACKHFPWEGKTYLIPSAWHILSRDQLELTTVLHSHISLCWKKKKGGESRVIGLQGKNESTWFWDSTRLPYQDKPIATLACELYCSVIKKAEIVEILEDYPVQLMHHDEKKLSHALWFLRREEPELKGSPVTGEQKVGPSHTLPVLCSLDATLPVISSSFVYYLPWLISVVIFSVMHQ